MKKILSLALALVLVLSMSTVAFAAEGEETTYTDMSTVTLTKEYKLTNAGTTSPAETFAFSALTCTNVTDAADSVTTTNAPVPTIVSVSYTSGEAGGENAKKNITITLPTYTSVGIYTYTFTETDGGTAGVTYRSDAITLVVTVIEQDGKVRVAAVHTEGEGEAKSGEFNNEYSAGSLSVKKTVTGIMGDQEKEFTVKVTFTAPEGDSVREAITYVDGTETKTIAAGEGWTGSKEVEITLKHDETVTFTNIPYGVTYTVVENDYTAEADGGYDAAFYNFDDNNKKIDTASESVTITNNKDGEIDTGINMDSMPYILLLAVACMGLFVFISKKRMMREF
jgi:pilin isopeptide linkage protein